jgi:multidrug efflux pump subunit AcrB
MSEQKPSALEQIIYNILEDKSKKLLIYIVAVILFLGSILMIPTELVKAKMLPGKDSDTFTIYVDLPKGKSVTEAKEVTSCIASILMQERDVLSTSVFLAEGQPLDFAGMVKGSALKSADNEAEMMVNINKASHRTEDSYSLVHRIRPIIQKQCSMHNSNIKFIELPAGPPVLASVVAEIYGGNTFDSRREFSYKIAKILEDQKTLVDVDVLAEETIKKYILILDNNKVIESGVGIDQVKKMLYIAFEGFEMGVVNDAHAQNQIPLFVRLNDTRILQNGTKEELEAKLKALKLMNQSGIRTSMSEFVSVKQTELLPTITSKNQHHMINVIAETDMDSQIYPLLDARTQMLESMNDTYIVSTTNMLNLSFKDKKTGETFNLKWDGELKVTIDTFIDLGVAFIGALILIYLLMVIYYKKFALAGAIVLSSFLSLVGVIIGHFVMDLITADTFYLTATSLIGFIGLIGINSRNSLLIVDFAKQLMEEKGYDANKAIAVSTATRAKPILLTVLAIVFASSLLAGDAVFGGLGVALIGGTLFAYLVSIFFVPVSIQNSLKN